MSLFGITQDCPTGIAFTDIGDGAGGIHGVRTAIFKHDGPLPRAAHGCRQHRQVCELSSLADTVFAMCSDRPMHACVHHAISHMCACVCALAAASYNVGMCVCDCMRPVGWRHGGHQHQKAPVCGAPRPALSVLCDVMAAVMTCSGTCYHVHALRQVPGCLTYVGP